MTVRYGAAAGAIVFVFMVASSLCATEQSPDTPVGRVAAFAEIVDDLPNVRFDHVTVLGDAWVVARLCQRGNVGRNGWPPKGAWKRTNALVANDRTGKTPCFVLDNSGLTTGFEWRITEFHPWDAGRIAVVAEILLDGEQVYRSEDSVDVPDWLRDERQTHRREAMVAYLLEGAPTPLRRRIGWLWNVGTDEVHRMSDWAPVHSLSYALHDSDVRWELLDEQDQRIGIEWSGEINLVTRSSGMVAPFELTNTPLGFPPLDKIDRLRRIWESGSEFLSGDDGQSFISFDRPWFHPSGRRFDERNHFRLRSVELDDELRIKWQRNWEFFDEIGGELAVRGEIISRRTRPSRVVALQVMYESGARKLVVLSAANGEVVRTIDLRTGSGESGYVDSRATVYVTDHSEGDERNVVQLLSLDGSNETRSYAKEDFGIAGMKVRGLIDDDTAILANSQRIVEMSFRTEPPVIRERVLIDCDR